MAEPDPRWCPTSRVVRLPDASHWVQHDEPERGQHAADRAPAARVKRAARALACAATMIRRALASLVLCLVLLAAGSTSAPTRRACPASSAIRWSATQDTRVVSEAIDQVNDTYYRKIPKKQAGQRVDRRDRRVAGRPLLQLLRPGRVQEVQAAAERRVRGDRRAGHQGRRRAAASSGLRRLAGQGRGRSRSATSSSRSAGTPLKGKTQDASVALIQGKIGTAVKLTRASAAGTSRDVTLARATISVPVVQSEERDGRRATSSRSSTWTSSPRARTARSPRR